MSVYRDSKSNKTAFFRRSAFACLLAGLALMLLLALAGCDGKAVLRIEAGVPMPAAANVVGDGTAVYLDPVEGLTDHPGSYTVRVGTSSKEYRVSVTVVDTRAPQVETRNLTIVKGSAVPDARDFIETLTDSEECTAVYEMEYDWKNAGPGTYRPSIIVRDRSGNETTCEVVLTIVSRDTTAPTILGAADIRVRLGEGIAYRKGVTAVDDCFGDVTLDVDSSAVDPKRVGTYPVVYTARDAAGNTASVTVHVYVYQPAVTLAQLNAKIDGVVAAIITPDMNKEAQLRAVYDYVYNHVAYSDNSDKSDWVAEAYHCLFVSGSGDCYSYFAAAKAFCERLGIENLDIQRLPGHVESATNQTHYWSLVNISDDPSRPLWYHFDCCHLRAEYNHSGCLLTDRQVRAYNRVRPGFRLYDTTAYPQSATAIITPTEVLEPYYD